MSKRLLFYYFEHDALSMKLLSEFYRVKAGYVDIDMYDISAIEHAEQGGTFPSEMTSIPSVILINGNNNTVLCDPKVISDLFSKMNKNLREQSKET